MALGAKRVLVLGDDHLAAVIAVKRGYSVSPPQLTGYAPVAYVLHPVEIVLFKPLRNKLYVLRPHRLYSGLSKVSHLDKPLKRHPRLYGCSAAVACADVVLVILYPHKISSRLKVGN